MVSVPSQLLFVALCLLLLLVAASAAPAASPTLDNSSNAVARYVFSREQCADGIGHFADEMSSNELTSLFGGIILGSEASTMGAAECAPGIGIDGPLYPSTGTSTTDTSLLLLSSTKSIQNIALWRNDNGSTNTGLSFEVWFKPRLPNHTSISEGDVLMPIFSIGTADPTNDRPFNLDNNCVSHADLQLRQVGEYFEVEYKTAQPRIPCNPKVWQRVASPKLTGDIVHVLISLTDRSQAIYVNGVPSSQNDHLMFPFDGATLSHWNQSSRLQFFADASSSTSSHAGATAASWDGRLYSFNIFDLALSEAAAKSLFESTEGLPYVAPVAMDINVVVQEDASMENATFSLPVYDFGAELASLHSSYGIVTETTVEEQKLVVKTIPRLGHLHQSDGARIAENGTEVTDSAFSVAYIPPENGHSVAGLPFDSFTYYAHFANGNSSTSSKDIATGRIQVEEVNDPPVALSTQVSIPTGVNHTTKISLTGTDVEDGSQQYLKVFLTSSPMHGQLFFLEQDGSYGSAISQDLDDGGTFIEAGEVGYHWFGQEVPTMSNASSNGLVGRDHFSFRVEDSEGVPSSAGGSVTIDAYTSLRSVPSTSLADTTAIENDASRSPILISGRDLSGFDRDLSFQLLSPPEHGQLFNLPQHSTALASGSIVTSSSKNTLVLYYEGAKNFFTSPRVNVGGKSTELFTFRAVALRNGSMIAASTPITQEIIVRNRNDEPRLILPDGAFEVNAFRALEYGTSNCSAYDAAEKEQQCSCQLVLPNIEVYDDDRNLEYVRVQINSSGIITLNSNAIHLADFISCAKRTLGWQCQGSGWGDRSMTFVTKPNDLSLILSSLTYENYYAGNDTITIAIYDGSGGECLAEQEHIERSNALVDEEPYITSLHDGCVVVSGSIPVKVVKSTIRENEMSNGIFQYISSIPIELWVAIIGGAIVLSAASLSCLVHLRRRHKRIYVCISSKEKYKADNGGVVGG